MRTSAEQGQDVAIPAAGWMRSHQAEAQLKDQGIDAMAYTVSYAEGGLLTFINEEGELAAYFVNNDSIGTKLASSLAREAWAAAIACDQTFARA